MGGVGGVVGGWTGKWVGGLGRVEMHVTRPAPTPCTSHSTQVGTTTHHARRLSLVCYLGIVLEPHLVGVGEGEDGARAHVGRDGVAQLDGVARRARQQHRVGRDAGTLDLAV